MTELQSVNSDPPFVKMLREVEDWVTRVLTRKLLSPESVYKEDINDGYGLVITLYHEGRVIGKRRFKLKLQASP